MTTRNAKKQTRNTRVSQRPSYLIAPLHACALCLALAACEPTMNDAAGKPAQAGAGATASEDQAGAPVVVPAAPAFATLVSKGAGSPSLQKFLEGVAFAFDNDPSARAASLRVRNSREAARDEAGFFRPTLSGQASTLDGGINIVATQPLVDFGKRAARVAEIEAEAVRDEVRLAQDRETLLNTALFAVIDADHARALIDLHRARIRDFTAARDSARRLADLNVLTEAEVRLAGVELQESEVDLAEARAMLAEAERAWQRVAGGRPLPSGLDPVVLQRIAGAGTGFAGNVDLRAIAAREAELDAQATSLSRRGLPTIDAVAQQDIRGGREGFKAGLELSFDLNPRDAASTRDAILRDKEALWLDREALLDELAFNRSNLAQRAADARNLMRIRQESLSLLRGRVEDLESQLENGLGRYTDVIQARSDLYDTRLEIEQNRHEARTNEARILLLSGVLIP